MFKNISIAARWSQRLILAMLLCLSPMAWSLDLNAAKTQGLVGETANGYLAVVNGSASASAKSLVASVNTKRKQKYQAIASKNGLQLKDVEALAGKKTIAKSSRGHYIMRAGGGWTKK